MTRTITFVVAALLAVCAPVFAAAQDDAPTAALWGEVLSPRGERVAKASVRALLLWNPTEKLLAPARAQTDARGRFAFAELPPGAYAVEASEPGVGAALVPRVQVAAGKSVHVVVQSRSQLAAFSSPEQVLSPQQTLTACVMHGPQRPGSHPTGL